MDTWRFQVLRFEHIRTQELALLVRCAEASGFGLALHTLAYRAELRRRADEAMATDRRIEFAKRVLEVQKRQAQYRAKEAMTPRQHTIPELTPCWCRPKEG